MYICICFIRNISIIQQKIPSFFNQSKTKLEIVLADLEISKWLLLHLKTSLYLKHETNILLFSLIILNSAFKLDSLAELYLGQVKHY